MSPEGIVPSGDCFLSSHCCMACEDFDGGHTVLFGQLECIVDNDWASASTGILLWLLVDLNPADKYPQQFGCQLGHLNILFCLDHKFLYAFLPHIYFANVFGNSC